LDHIGVDLHGESHITILDEMINISQFSRL